MTDLHEVKDPVVAIHLAKMEGKLEALKTSNEAIGRQLEYVTNELREVVKVSSKLPDHDDAVKRIWQELETRDKLWDERLHATNSSTLLIRDRVNKIFWFGAGFSSVSGVLLGIIIWLVLGELDHTKQLADRIRQIELYLVSDRQTPFKAD